MIRVFKTLLLWLLIAILPIRGYAAIAGASCDMADQTTMQGAAAHDTRKHGEQAVHAPAHQYGKQATASQATDPSAPATHSDNMHHPAKSVYCGVCFGAAAPPVAINRFPAAAASEPVVLVPLISPAGHIPARIERPPKHPSA